VRSGKRKKRNEHAEAEEAGQGALFEHVDKQGLELGKHVVDQRVK
jgi:hypothetical protein